jgi:hypothetical protein
MKITLDLDSASAAQMRTLAEICGASPACILERLLPDYLRCDFEDTLNLVGSIEKVCQRIEEKVSALVRLCDSMLATGGDTQGAWDFLEAPVLRDLAGRLFERSYPSQHAAEAVLAGLATAISQVLEESVYAMVKKGSAGWVIEGVPPPQIEARKAGKTYSGMTPQNIALFPCGDWEGVA